MKFKSKKAILWDNDGVLVDTEKYFYQATKEIVKKKSIELTDEMFVEYVLIQSVGPWHLLEQQGHSKEVISGLKRERDQLYMQLLQNHNILIDGVEETLKLMSEKYTMGIVTSSKPHHFDAIHVRTGILKYFTFIITPENYTNYKPHPEPYLTGWQKTNLSKEECIVVEDSRRGLLSAKAAGLECIIIPNELTKISDFSEADLVLNNIKDLRKIFL